MFPYLALSPSLHYITAFSVSSHSLLNCSPQLLSSLALFLPLSPSLSPALSLPLSLPLPPYLLPSVFSIQ